MPSLVTWQLGSYSFSATAAGGSEGTRLGTQMVPRRSGSVVQAAPPSQPTLLTLRGILTATTALALRTAHRAQKAAFKAGRQQLKQWDDCYTMASLEDYDFDWGQGYRILEWMATFHCDDPFWISTTEDVTTDSAGTPWNPIINPGGDAPSPLVILVTAPAGGLTDFSAVNNTTVKTFTWSGNLSAGQALEIDMENYTVTENGVADLTGIDRTVSSFWNLASGNNDIDFTSTPSGAVVEVTSRARWYI